MDQNCSTQQHCQRVRHTRNLRLAVTFASAAVLLAVPSADGFANPLRSRLTTIETKTCKILQRHSDGNAYLCPGLKGYPVYFAEGDLRTFFSFGAAPEKRRAATQTLSAFNTVFEPKRSRATVEWRFRRIAGQDVPYAAILRLFTSNDTGKGEVLVVTRISAAETCHAVYIDAKANPEAMAMARAAADTIADGFNCAHEPRVLGARSQNPF